ncbi:unnamed protein product [Sphenostylis stenocarpa]|uniref:PGG domain-containing protein n=1 Tax=Sphenostylis stenocarpa TaxID=92480 RepID=A0AA86SRW6_9FABA|nr:unnamed protein product [Sphenostylis stenocarpa]
MKGVRWRNWMEDKRGSLMVVATVIATMTFQIAINPPGGVWQAKTHDQQGCEAVICTAGAYAICIWMILNPLKKLVGTITLYYALFWGGFPVLICLAIFCRLAFWILKRFSRFLCCPHKNITGSV